MRESEADYVLALKGNQSELQEMVSDFLPSLLKKILLPLSILELKIMIMVTDGLNQRFVILFRYPIILRIFVKIGLT